MSKRLETTALPSLTGVAALAVVAKAALMNVVLAVATGALGWRFFLDAIAVAGGTSGLGVGTQQREVRFAVIE